MNQWKSLVSTYYHTLYKICFFKICFLDDSGSRLSLRRSGTLSLGHNAPAIPSAVKPFKVSLHTNQRVLCWKQSFFCLQPTPLGDDATRKQFVQMKYVEKTFMTKVDATPRDLAQRLSEEVCKTISICFHFVEQCQWNDRLVGRRVDYRAVCYCYCKEPL